MQGASVHTVDPVNIENIYFQDKYQYSEIYWDLHCATAIKYEHKLFFLNNENPGCDEILKRNVTYLLVSSDINYRSSSQSYNQIKLNQFLKLRNDLKMSETLFTTKKEMTEKNIGHYLSCSNSTDIHVMNYSTGYNAEKLIGKTLMKNNFIQESMSVILNGVKYHTMVYCEMVPHNTKLISDEKTLVANILNKTSSDGMTNCCLNTTHTLKSFGQCNYHQDDLQMIKNKHFIKEGTCNDKKIQNFLYFEFLEGPCIVKVIYSRNCNDASRIIHDCFVEPCKYFFL